MIPRMSLPENALNVPDFDFATVETLLTPTKLWTRPEVLARPCPVPASAGVYAWFFDSCPQGVPTEGLVRSVGLALLYVGISPKPPSTVGTQSRQTLRSRLRYHFRGNAEGSTLRLSLGCLLSQSLGIELRRVDLLPGFLASFSRCGCAARWDFSVVCLADSDFVDWSPELRW